MQPSDHLLSFQRKVQRVRRLLARQIDLSQMGLVPRTELEAVYELAFLNVFVAFENDLTELFKTNLMMRTAATGKKRSIFAPGSRALADKLLLGTNRYFQLLPVEQMEKTARIYLKDGGPFVLLQGPQKQAIGKAHAIRNHIAHKSPESTRKFKRKVLEGVALPKASLSPGYYLKNSISVNRTYFDHHVAEIGGALRHVCDAS